jgi:hypothetical protein
MTFTLPANLGKLKAARKIAGQNEIIKIEGQKLACVATNSWAARLRSQPFSKELS